MLLMMTSCVAWAQTIATFSGVASTLQPDVNAYRQTMDDLNRFMERESFPGSMRIRLRSYFNASRHLRLAETQRKLLQYMPPSLQGEVSQHANSSTAFARHRPVTGKTRRARLVGM